MVKKLKINRVFTRFSDFIMGFIIACLVITLGRMVLAGSIDDDVNTHIKEEFIKMDIAQKRALMTFPDPSRINALKNEDWSQKRPITSAADGQFSHSDDISPSEQSQYLERPRAGYKRMSDPLDSIEDKIIESQAVKLYREHYRSAVKQEFITRAHAVGIEPTNEMTNDITARVVDGETSY
jgi:hypothetical protein